MCKIEFNIKYMCNEIIHANLKIDLVFTNLISEIKKFFLDSRDGSRPLRNVHDHLTLCYFMLKADCRLLICTITQGPGI